MANIPVSTQLIQLLAEIEPGISQQSIANAFDSNPNPWRGLEISALSLLLKPVDWPFIHALIALSVVLGIGGLLCLWTLYLMWSRRKQEEASVWFFRRRYLAGSSWSYLVPHSSNLLVLLGLVSCACMEGSVWVHYRSIKNPLDVQPKKVASMFILTWLPAFISIWFSAAGCFFLVYLVPLQFAPRNHGQDRSFLARTWTQLGVIVRHPIFINTLCYGLPAVFSILMTISTIVQYGKLDEMYDLASNAFGQVIGLAAEWDDSQSVDPTHLAELSNTATALVLIARQWRFWLSSALLISVILSFVALIVSTPLFIALIRTSRRSAKVRISSVAAEHHRPSLILETASLPDPSQPLPRRTSITIQTAWPHSPTQPRRSSVTRRASVELIKQVTFRRHSDASSTVAEEQRRVRRRHLKTVVQFVALSITMLILFAFFLWSMITAPFVKASESVQAFDVIFGYYIYGAFILILNWTYHSVSRGGPKSSKSVPLERSRRPSCKPPPMSPLDSPFTNPFSALSALSEKSKETDIERGPQDSESSSDSCEMSELDTVPIIRLVPPITTQLPPQVHFEHRTPTLLSPLSLRSPMWGRSSKQSENQ